MSNGLSKSRFLIGSQCHRALWWSIHDPEAPELEIDDATAVVLTQGHMVGEEARRRFPGGVLVDLPHDAVAERIAQTARLMRSGVDVIFEASFQANGVFVAVDVLRRLNEGWQILEVKSSTKVKPEHRLDVALQRHVLRACGVDVRRVSLMHLDRACVYPDLSNLFTIADLTEDAIALEDHVARESQIQRAMLQGGLPIVETGAHCHEPRACPFFDRCHAGLPEHHISELYRTRLDNVQTLYDIDDTTGLSPVARRQVQAVQSGQLIVEPTLADALSVIRGKIAFFDLETVAFAIPRFDRCRPWDAVPAQASVHVDDGTHHEILADGTHDPRPPLARFLVDVLGDADTILVWNAGFERRCLTALAAVLPDQKKDLLSIADRLVDLLPIVRDHVYHPAFHGSFSLKDVAPALVGVRYDDDVATGSDASALLFRHFTERRLDPAERDALLAYCAKDTDALVRILAFLRDVAKAPSPQPRRPRASPPITRAATRTRSSASSPASRSEGCNSRRGLRRSRRACDRR